MEKTVTAGMALRDSCRDASKYAALSATSLFCAGGKPPWRRTECLRSKGALAHPVTEYGWLVYLSRLTRKACPNQRTWTKVSLQLLANSLLSIATCDVAWLKTGSRPQGLIESDWGGTPVQAWTQPEGLAACGFSTTNRTMRKAELHAHPSVLYNHMVFPFVGYGFVAFCGIRYAARCTLICQRRC